MGPHLRSLKKSCSFENLPKTLAALGTKGTKAQDQDWSKAAPEIISCVGKMMAKLKTKVEMNSVLISEAFGALKKSAKDTSEIKPRLKRSRLKLKISKPSWPKSPSSVTRPGRGT
jgi:hypothetical protein